MYCPVCENVELNETMTQQGTLVDLCGNCEGLWLDQGEIFDFTDSPEHIQRALETAHVGDEATDRNCPRCTETMVEMNFLFDNLWVDRCRNCEGLWFDHGELELAVGRERGEFMLDLDETAELDVDIFRDADPESEATPPSDRSDDSAASTGGPDGGAFEIEPNPAGSDAASGGAQTRDGARAGGAAAAGALPDLFSRSMISLFGLYAILGVALILCVELDYLTAPVAMIAGVGFAAVQFLISPWLMDRMMDWTYHMSWVGTEGLPDHLQQFVEDVCDHEGMDLPSVGLIHDGAPNAFTYGHTPNDARIVITQGLLDLLDQEEAEAVVAHEIGHARNWDMLVMTIANVVPLMLYLIFRMTVGSGDSDSGGSKTAIVGVAAYVLYFVSEYVVLYLSRVREYHADRYAGRVTGNPNSLAAALVRIGYGLAARGSTAEHDEETAQLDEWRSGKDGSIGDAHRAQGRKAPDEEDDDDSGSNLDALGALGIFDADASKSLAIASQDSADNDGSVEETDIDRERLVHAMRWDLWNPWAKFHELNSTHPLIAERLQMLAEQSKARGRRPFVEFDLEKPESYWDEFAVDLLAFVGPLAMLVLTAVVGVPFLISTGSLAPMGILLFLTGVSFVGSTVFAYRSDAFPRRSVAGCLKNVKASAIRGIPVTLEGTLIGRGIPGLIWSEDFVLQDDTGIIFVDYRQPLHIWEFLFGLLRNEDYQDREVRLKGWYRRSPVPYIELKELQVDGETKTSYVYHAKLAGGVLAAVAGLFLIGTMAI